MSPVSNGPFSHANGLTVIPRVEANEYVTTYGGDVIHLIRIRDLLHQQLTEAIKGELERAELAERGEQDRQVHVPDELLAQD